MPSRPQVHHGASPRTSSHAVNEVVSALQRKLIAHHVDNAHPPTPPPRRTSFSMDNILHLKKDRKHDQSPDRSTREEKRKSLLTGKPSSKSRDRTATRSPRVAPLRPGRFEIVRESPPLVMHHGPATSTGALMSEKIKLHVDDPSGSITLNTWTATLRAVRTTQKPIGKDCSECSTQYDVLKTSDVIKKPTTFTSDKDNSVPFSFLFQGHLPATTQCQLGGISYEILLEATTSMGESITLRDPVLLQRALPEGLPRSSVRIFPPTNLTGRVELPPVIHPIGKFNVEMKLSGVVDKRASSQTRWRLRKLTWRIEEHSKIISLPCPKHVNRLSENKAIQYTETRTLGSNDLKSGWKSDFDTAGGEITCEFEASVATKPSHKAVCDVESPSGLGVSHNLVIELIVAEEFCPNKNTQIITPTGAARVLRMQFALVVTERAGMGISWEDEQPPMYEDVPDSPPGYGSADRNDGAWGGAEILEYNGEPLEYTDLERLPSEDPNGPQLYRERDVGVDEELPMRTRPSSSGGEPSRTNAFGRRGGWTEEELNAEPYLRRRSSADVNNQQDDFAAGEASGTAAWD